MYSAKALVVSPEQRRMISKLKYLLDQKLYLLVFAFSVKRKIIFWDTILYLSRMYLSLPPSVMPGGRIVRTNSEGLLLYEIQHDEIQKENLQASTPNRHHWLVMYKIIWNSLNIWSQNLLGLKIFGLI